MAYSDRDKTLSVRISQELLDKLDEKASSKNCTRTDYILAVLGNDVGVEIEPPKVWGEERIIALENKVKNIEKRMLTEAHVLKIIEKFITTTQQVRAAIWNAGNINQS